MPKRSNGQARNLEELLRHLDQKVLESIKRTFSKRALGSLFPSRDGKLPSASESPSDLGDQCELLTWLVILDPSSNSHAATD